tara:strand:+ start:1151 stop:1513 length:363 start_codon:yes stop_codon:yes gene_type:complete
MEETNLHEIYVDVEQAIDYAFQYKFVLKFYDYLKIKKIKKYEVEKFIESSVANELSELIMDLEEYLEGGNDNNHKQLREAYGHIPKPQARKIKNYLYAILEDAWKYNHDKRKGRRKKASK